MYDAKLKEERIIGMFPVLHVSTYSRFEDLQFDSIRIECKVCNSPADNNTFQLAQVALNGLLQSGEVQVLIVNRSSVVSGITDKWCSH